MHNKCSKTWREALTRGPGQEDDDLEGPAIATVGQVDDERDQTPVAARSDAHGDAVGLLVDPSSQLVPQVVQGPPPDMVCGPAFPGLVVEPLVARLHEPNPPNTTTGRSLCLHLSRKQSCLYSLDQKSRVILSSLV